MAVLAETDGKTFFCLPVILLIGNDATKTLNTLRTILRVVAVRQPKKTWFVQLF